MQRGSGWWIIWKVVGKPMHCKLQCIAMHYCSFNKWNISLFIHNGFLFAGNPMHLFNKLNIFSHQLSTTTLSQRGPKNNILFRMINNFYQIAQIEKIWNKLFECDCLQIDKFKFDRLVKKKWGVRQQSWQLWKAEWLMYCG